MTNPVKLKSSTEKGQEIRPSEEPEQELERSSSLNSIGRHIQNEKERPELPAEPSQPSARKATRKQQHEETARLETQRDEVLQANIRAKDRAFAIIKFRLRVDEAYHVAGLHQQFHQLCAREAQNETLRDASAEVWKDLHRDYMKGSAALLVEMKNDREMGASVALPQELQDLIFAPWAGMNAERERAHCDAIVVQLRHWLLEVRRSLDSVLEVALSGLEVAVKMLIQMHSERPRDSLILSLR